MKTVRLSVAALLFAVVLLSGCGVSYMGKSYSPTTHVEVFVNPYDIVLPYETMGEASVSLQVLSVKQAQAKIEQYAREKGADAMILHGVSVYTAPPTYTTTQEYEKRDDGSSKMSTTTSQSAEQVGYLTATLIKYKIK